MTEKTRFILYWLFLSQVLAIMLVLPMLIHISIDRSFLLMLLYFEIQSIMPIVIYKRFIHPKFLYDISYLWGIICVVTGSVLAIVFSFFIMLLVSAYNEYRYGDYGGVGIVGVMVLALFIFSFFNTLLLYLAHKYYNRKKGKHTDRTFKTMK
jgi:hypothetical protein